MNKLLKKELKKYYKAIKAELTCSSNMKLAVIKDLKIHVKCYVEENPNITLGDITGHFGSPKEISDAFETRDDLERLKKMAKKYKRLKIILPILTLLLIGITIFTTILVIEIERSKNERSEFRIYDGEVLKN